jgi:hypothetical protein
MHPTYLGTIEHMIRRPTQVTNSENRQLAAAFKKSGRILSPGYIPAY